MHASSKDNLAQSMQHSFATFQFDAHFAQCYDNIDPKQSQSHLAHPDGKQFLNLIILCVVKVNSYQSCLNL